MAKASDWKKICNFVFEHIKKHPEWFKGAIDSGNISELEKAFIEHPVDPNGTGTYINLNPLDAEIRFMVEAFDYYSKTLVLYSMLLGESIRFINKQEEQKYNVYIRALSKYTKKEKLNAVLICDDCSLDDFGYCKIRKDVIEDLPNNWYAVRADDDGKYGVVIFTHIS